MNTAKLSSIGDQPLVIAVAPNGARKTKADHPRLPISPTEIAAEAEACVAAGASMIHLHVRDSEGRHSLNAAIYGDATAAVRRALGDAIVVQMTTEAVGIYTADEQIDAVQAVQPEAVSIAIREIVPDTASEDRAAAFFAGLAERRVLAQFILYTPEEIGAYAGLCERGVIPDADHTILFVLGRYAADQRSSPTDLLPFVERYMASGITVPWMVCAFGEREAECMATAISLGGHARVGFENNQLLPDGSVAQSNVDAIESAAAVARALGRPIADGALARSVLGGMNAGG